VFRFGEAGDGDLVDVLEGEASDRVEEEGEVALGDAMRAAATFKAALKPFPEILRVPDDLAVLDDGLAAVVRVGGETDPQTAEAGEDGGAEERSRTAPCDGRPPCS